ncbi:MAG: asparagine synthase (glutamine-hydrolyzing) [Myxococcota bacterium]|nr:asparagine synthase (glutamine-hydrolyzing) [Myxococcota bacterium]
MCGIFGVIARPGRFGDADVLRATRALDHRGPDGHGVERVFASDSWEVWLGHTRLAILDLSADGHQPMRGFGGVIVFNGEIYDHRARRDALRSDGIALRSSSDTEVLLAGLMRDGPDYVARCNGMLALGAWRESDRTLVLARDRLGKKPLYLYETGDVLAFASELKAFHALGVPLTEDPEAWAHYHWLRHVPGERSIYRECRKLPAASHATVTLPAGGSSLPRVRSSLYWDPLRACGERFEGRYDDAIDELLALVDDATALRLDADVPVGVFLSGGIDSSLVAASVAGARTGEISAYIVKAEDPALDESEVATRTAARLGLRACVLDLRRRDYDRQIERIPFAYDEPCAPLSQIPTMAIAEAARRHVKVVLTGDGGDEVFVGYPWLGFPERLFRYRRPLDLVPGAGHLARRALPTRAGRAALRMAARTLGISTADLAGKERLAHELLRATSPAELYDFFQELQPRRTLSPDDARHLGPGGLLARAKRDYPEYSWDAAEARPLPELLAALELVTSMRDEILVKLDRGTMAHSLEARSPLLDYRVVELGLRLPLEHKAHEGVYKRILRDACARRVDRELARRKKSGFGIPPPEDLPPGPSDAARWALAVEGAWRRRWSARETVA